MSATSFEVAALFVEQGGVYFGLPHVDPWPEGRDARRYNGPLPVVAHPPCPKWSPLAYINRRRIPGYEIGDDGGCFEAALSAVRRFGGVLEHPANTLAWRHFDLQRPSRGLWLGHNGAWVTEVDQGRYGHRARKRTWLYVTTWDEPPPLEWSSAESTAIVSGFTHQPRGQHVACEQRRVRPAEASRTPVAFRDVLIEIARGAAHSSRSPKPLSGANRV